MRSTGVGVGLGLEHLNIAGSGGGGTPVLLPGLVGGWALTGGPEQTLSSAGVIASGPLDLTNNNGVTFGVSGATFDGVNQTLSHVQDSSINISNQDFFVNLTVKVLAPLSEFQSVVLYGNTNVVGNDQYALLLDDDGDGVQCTLTGYTGALTPSPGVAFTPEVTYVVCWWKTGGSQYLQLGAAAPTSVAFTGTAITTFDHFAIGGTVDYEGYNVNASFKDVRVVIGDISAWIAAKDWLGAGRTDAEIAAYTG